MRAWIAQVFGVIGVLALVWTAILTAPLQSSLSERLRELLAPSAVVLGWAFISSIAFRGTGRTFARGMAVRWAVVSWSALALGLCTRAHWKAQLVAENLVLAGVLGALATALAAAVFIAIARFEGSRE
ncbi:MAG: hypothetical protein QM817_40160 [Archangium sp.]